MLRQKKRILSNEREKKHTASLHKKKQIKETESQAAQREAIENTLEFSKASSRLVCTLRNLLLISVVVAGPYVALVGYCWLHLWSGLLRRPVTVDMIRPLLIVGTQSSGTTWMTAELNKLGLEIGHEVSDTTWHFARDGTVSWFHGIRFFIGNVSSDSLHILCSRYRANMGFHPAMFRKPRLNCSYRQVWNKCWQEECIDILSQEWGCAIDSSCETPYNRSLLQLRNPIRTAESLAFKFCASTKVLKDEKRSIEFGSPHPFFIEFVAALWPEHHGWGLHSCIEAVGWYVGLYMNDMLRASDRGLIHESYAIEESDACSVSELGGLLSSRPDISLKCVAKHAEEENSLGKGQRNTRNLEQVRFELKDFGDELRAYLEMVVRRSGYELPEVV